MRYAQRSKRSRRIRSEWVGGPPQQYLGGTAMTRREQGQLSRRWSAWGFWSGLQMPRYFFDVTNGHRLIDPTGLDCKDDNEALSTAKIIARQIQVAGPSTPWRKLAVMNSEGQEVGYVMISGPAEERSDLEQQRESEQGRERGRNV